MQIVLGHLTSLGEPYKEGLEETGSRQKVCCALVLRKKRELNDRRGQQPLGAVRLSPTEKGNVPSPSQHLDCSLGHPEQRVQTPDPLKLR